MAMNRVTVPEEFYDITSSLILVQPEPQYLHARLIKMALGAELADLSEDGLPGRAIIGGGEDYASNQEMRNQISDPIFESAVTVIAELGKGPGHVVRINRPKFTDSEYTQAKREIPSGATISTTPIEVASEQASITLKRFGGPYSVAQGAVAPIAIDRFDAQLPIHRLVKIKGFHLIRDFDKTIDSFGVALMNTASSATYPKGFAADSDIVTADAAPLDYNTLSRTARNLGERHIPRFPNGKYGLIITERQAQELTDDSQFARYVRYFQQMNPAFGGAQWAEIDSFTIFKSETLSKVVNASGVSVHYAQAFGPGAIGVGLGDRPRVMPHTNDNYGETALSVWLMYAGFACLDNRFIELVKSS